MKKQWVPILILVWLVLLTGCMVLFQMRTGVVDDILYEQDRQAGILIKQSEILAQYSPCPGAGRTGAVRQGNRER